MEHCYVLNARLNAPVMFILSMSLISKAFAPDSIFGRDRIAITVCHYPPGTSKWNKVEHRLFSFISMNWRGRPLLSYETVVNLIGATTAKSGLWVKALLDTREYEPGQKIMDEEMRRLQLKPHKFHGDWNYTLEPRRVT